MSVAVIRHDEDLSGLDKRCRSSFAAITSDGLQTHIAVLNEGRSPAYAVLKASLSVSSAGSSTCHAQTLSRWFPALEVTIDHSHAALPTMQVTSQAPSALSDVRDIGSPVRRPGHSLLEAASRWLDGSANAVGAALGGSSSAKGVAAWQRHRVHGRRASSETDVQQSPSSRRHRRQLTQSPTSTPTLVRTRVHAMLCCSALARLHLQCSPAVRLIYTTSDSLAMSRGIDGLTWATTCE